MASSPVLPHSVAQMLKKRAHQAGQDDLPGIVGGEIPLTYGGDEADHPAVININDQYDLVTLTEQL